MVVDTSGSAHEHWVASSLNPYGTKQLSDNGVHPHYPPSRPTSATPYISNYTTIIHDEEGLYEHVPTRDYPSGSISSRPEHMYSNRTSITSSGSTFSQLDSPAELVGHGRRAEQDSASVTRPQRATLKRYAEGDMQIAPVKELQVQGLANPHIAFRESQQLPREHRASKIASAHMRDRAGDGQRDSQSSCNVYVHQGYSEKADSSWRTTYPECIEEPTPKLWRVMMYLIIANPLVCGVGAFFAVFSVFAAVIISPFRRNASSSERLTSLSSSSDIPERSRFSNFLVSQLLPLHEFHFRLLTARPMHIVDSRCASPSRLVLVHFISPWVAVLVSLSSVCVFFAWIYGLILSDSSEVSGMQEWVVVKWEAYLMKAFVAQ